MNKLYSLVFKVTLLCLLLFAGGGAVQHIPIAQAGAIITVNDVNDVVLAGNSRCTLREAIENANTNSDTTSGDCAAGTGDDTIVFEDQGGAPDIYEVMASLQVKDALVIAGLGQDELSIQAAPLMPDPIFDVTAVSGDPVTFKDMTIRDANGTGNGGGIYNNGSTLFIMDSMLRDNGAGHGGGLFNDGGDVTIDNSTLENNSAVSQGGGIANLAFGTVTILESTITLNNAGSSGGGIFNEDGTLSLHSSTVDHNWADSAGGILNGGTLSILNSTLSANMALSGSGGGLFSAGGLASAAVSNSTFSENEAFVSGDGIYNEEILTLSETIIGDYFITDDCSGSMAPVSLGNNLDSDNTCNLSLPTDIPSGNALLGLLAYNGGPTKTHELLDGSEAIDAVDESDCPPPVADQRGIFRPADGDGDNNVACDIGSFELAPENAFLPFVVDD